MQTVAITPERPIRQLVEHRSWERNVSPQEVIEKLIALGFETFLREQSDRYRHGEISFGRLAQELGITTWELSHLPVVEVVQRLGGRAPAGPPRPGRSGASTRQLPLKPPKTQE